MINENENIFVYYSNNKLNVKYSYDGESDERKARQDRPTDRQIDR